MNAFKITLTNGNHWTTNMNATPNRQKFPPALTTASPSSCKRNGFRWSPQRGAWSRMLSNGAIWAADSVKAEWLKEHPETAA